MDVNGNRIVRISLYLKKNKLDKVVMHIFSSSTHETDRQISVCSEFQDSQGYLVTKKRKSNMQEEKDRQTDAQLHRPILHACFGLILDLSWLHPTVDPR